MAREGLVSPAESVLMVEPRHLDQLLHPMFEGVGLPAYTQAVLGKGLPASPGAAVGRIVFTAEEAEKWEKAGEKVGGLGGLGGWDDQYSFGLAVGAAIMGGWGSGSGQQRLWAAEAPCLALQGRQEADPSCCALLCAC